MDERYNGPWVAQEVARCAAVWHDCADHPAELEPLYSPRDHESREIAYDMALDEVEWEAKRLARNPADRGSAEQRMIAPFARFAQNALDLEQEQIGLLTDDFLPAGIDFARRARQFDPAISREDTIQACRNAWTACGLQPLLGVPSGITPSILAYSLLYPYSDNYLDSGEVCGRRQVCFQCTFSRASSGLDDSSYEPTRVRHQGTRQEHRARVSPGAFSGRLRLSACYPSGTGRQRGPARQRSGDWRR